ncbi:hypothetical protein [Clostridium taeniosporum]|uniref:Uncharacterized protein n=1 Tax=Clostridium taeniosporum TaxID=394958 RepID=A0A1D7XKE1_9CLOT|nr:hypothetical protein [Clostridium taeniosporum]AOR23811.1 hypothetical protein BGI42_08760 [Clostridium taeniosporum]
MNYGTLKKYKVNFVASATKNISHNKKLENSLDLSEILTHLWSGISKLFNRTSGKNYNSNNYYYYDYNNKYTVEDPTEIRLISSRRTFY